MIVSPEHRFKRMYLTTSCGCWLWMGSIDRDGYGRFTETGKNVLAHRFSYEHVFGKIFPGLELDHLCRIPACVNPEHVEPVTHRMNMLRSATMVSINATKTHCSRGHLFDQENTYRYRKQRICKACNALAVAAYRERKRK